MSTRPTSVGNTFLVSLAKTSRRTQEESDEHLANKLYSYVEHLVVARLKLRAGDKLIYVPIKKIAVSVVSSSVPWLFQQPAALSPS